MTKHLTPVVANYKTALVVVMEHIAAVGCQAPPQAAPGWYLLLSVQVCIRHFDSSLQVRACRYASCVHGQAGTSQEHCSTVAVHHVLVAVHRLERVCVTVLILGDHFQLFLHCHENVHH